MGRWSSPRPRGLSTEFTTQPRGIYDLATQNRHFGGWAALAAQGGTIVMAFPVEGGRNSAAVAIRQEEDGRIRGQVHGDAEPDRAWQQALAVLSLDIDGSGYAAVGERDPVIGALQREHGWLRPLLFHSPYEAACSFIIGHRISIAQGRIIRGRLAETHGAAIEVGDHTVHAFPTPERLLKVSDVPSLNAEKVARLHGVARAALEGWLDRAALRGRPVPEALARVRELRGVGDFFAQGIVLRGAGVVDELPTDTYTLAGVRRFYKLSATPRVDQLREIAESWKPYRMWCAVLVHASERRAQGQGSGGSS